MGNLSTPMSVQKLQTALHAKAKAEAGYRFYALYDKISRDDILAHAYAQWTTFLQLVLDRLFHSQLGFPRWLLNQRKYLHHFKSEVQQSSITAWRSEWRGKRSGSRALVAGGDASAASTLEADVFSRQTLPCCVPVFLAVRWRLSLRGTAHLTRKMPEGYLHLTYEQRCQIYGSCKAATRKPTSRGKWRRRRRSAASCSQHRRARLSLQASAQPRRDAKRPRTSRAK